MWIVRLALRRPYTFVVLALLIAVLGVAAIVTMPVDIFPAINIPVVNVIWNYSGLSPTEMQDRIVTISERAFTTTVSGIEHIESVSLRGVAVTRLYFQPNVPIEAAIAQVNAQAQQIVRQLPPGIFPPLIIQYNAASVPVVLVSLSSDQLPEQQLNDFGNNFIRTQLVTVPGAAIPVPYGGKVRVVNVDVDPEALYARGLSPQDVSSAILSQNVILPAGTVKIGTREYDVATNSSPEVLADLNKIPIRYVNGAMVNVGDVAFVHDGFSPQTNLVRRDGHHSALLPILSNGSASTLAVVNGARQLMPKILAGLPSSLKVDFLFDQSVFVRAAVTGVIHEGVIAGCLTALMILVFGAFALASLGLYPFVGRDFFPTVDAGQLRLHVRAPAGTRIEETEVYFQRIEDYIRQVIPAAELNVITDNIGVPNPINLALSDSVTVGPADGEILVSLKAPHGPTAQYLKRLRDELPRRFPDCEFFAQPADIVSQILNFGLPAPIDVQVTGPLAESEKNFQVAQRFAAELRRVPGAVDVHVQQVLDAPRIMVNTDRALAQQVGLTQRDVAGNLLISLTGSGATTTNFWLNYQNGVSYQVVVQTPQHRLSSLDELHRTPVAIAGQSPQLLRNLADFNRTVTPLSLNHYNVQPVFDVYAAVQDTDLGSVSSRISGLVAKYTKEISGASSIVVRGQVQSMNQSFFQMALGICFAVLLVYFLMVVNFQSWMDPLIILMALPGALAGILWALFVTGTTISVPALMGCIMAIGVATSNSILMITFANEQRHPEFGGHEAREAALLAGRTRLRPVLMTALAMLIGMLPMSLGLGEGGEQNAPLGRAVIGGLMVATFYTLFFVPVTYSLLRRRPPRDLSDETGN